MKEAMFGLRSRICSHRSSVRRIGTPLTESAMPRIISQIVPRTILTRSPIPQRSAVHLLSSDLQDLSHLLIPVGPVVIAGQFAVFVWDLLLAQQCGELLISADQAILSAAIEIEIWKSRDAIRRHRTDTLEDIVCFASVGTSRPKHTQHRIASGARIFQVLLRPGRRGQGAAQ